MTPADTMNAFTAYRSFYFSYYTLFTDKKTREERKECIEKSNEQRKHNHSRIRCMRHRRKATVGVAGVGPEPLCGIFFDDMQDPAPACRRNVRYFIVEGRRSLARRRSARITNADGAGKEREIACRTGMDGRTFPPRSRAPAICLCIQWTYRCPNGICVSGFAGVVGESAVSAVRIDPAAVPRINEGIRRCANVAEMKWSLLPARNFCAGFLSAGRLFPDLPSRKNSLKALAIMRKI